MVEILNHSIVVVKWKCSQIINADIGNKGIKIVVRVALNLTRSIKLEDNPPVTLYLNTL